MVNRCQLRVGATALGTAYTLCHFVPRPAELAHDLGSPETWVAGAGADHAAATLAGALLCLTAAWIAIAMTVTVASLLPGRFGRLCQAIAGRVTPAMLRRAVVATVGTTILISPATALADPAVTAQPSAGTTTQASQGDSAPMPPIGWPADPPARTSPGGGYQPARAVGGTDRVTVRSGESLWSIAAHRLGAAAPASQISAEWPRWYAANRRLIGADPNLLRPGMGLLAPGRPLSNTEE